jgi:hypothetical protein
LVGRLDVDVGHERCKIVNQCCCLISKLVKPSRAEAKRFADQMVFLRWYCKAFLILLVPMPYRMHYLTCRTLVRRRNGLTDTLLATRKIYVEIYPKHMPRRIVSWTTLPACPASMPVACVYIVDTAFHPHFRDTFNTGVEPQREHMLPRPAGNTILSEDYVSTA